MGSNPAKRAIFLSYIKDLSSNSSRAIVSGISALVVDFPRDSVSFEAVDPSNSCANRKRECTDESNSTPLICGDSCDDWLDLCKVLVGAEDDEVFESLLEGQHQRV